MKIIKGDLIDLAKKGQFDIIAHGANCFNIMGAGIAQQIQLEFPSVFEADQMFNIPVGSPQRLGCFSGAVINNLLVLNFYTQFKIGKNFDIDALKSCLVKLNWTGIAKGKRIGLPLIGCGIGGGDWKEVEKVISEYSNKFNFDITIVEYSKF